MNHQCCDEFAKAQEQARTDGSLYARIDFYDDEKTWHVLGCCNNCHVVKDIKFCPFCGAKLTVESQGDAPAT